MEILELNIQFPKSKIHCIVSLPEWRKERKESENLEINRNGNSEEQRKKRLNKN